MFTCTQPPLLKSVSQSVFCGTSTYCVLNTVPPLEDDHGNSNSSHVKIFLPKKLLECLPKCSSLPKERHRWNTNEVFKLRSDRAAFPGIGRQSLMQIMTQPPFWISF
ncbi:calmodulin-binding transcription activator 1-like isoform X1 [Pteropus vampyrus]|uniref:Calmodulin-binding transcription activator 1-like isoform X1 n=1 Tax=Pteropus vampyrus TaxID=132908 RepID=A0A6P6CVM5_PTEVA|nr:calmodulin-binding transcription activator 1-like isoform X1 [Pteropus vampyrus]